MSFNNLLEQANSHVIEVNKIMSEVENVEKIIDAIKEPEQVISFTQRGVGTTYIDGTLTPEELSKLKETVMVCIMQNRNDKIAKLENLLGIRKPAIVNPDFEAAVQEMVQQDKVKDDYKPWRDEVVLRRMYLDEDKSAAQIAEELGCKTTDVYNGLDKCRIPAKKTYKKRGQEPDPEPVYPEITKETVKQYYITEAHTLEETARYFGKTKKEMHDFIEIQGVMKNFQKVNDPFISSNKMSASEFKKQMMKGRIAYEI